MITRFAPSPTGYLHLGHAMAAKVAFGLAEINQGQCLLRIEDIDHTRCRPEYHTAIYEDLAWLGFKWAHPPHIQSQHLGSYAKTLHKLKTKHLIYRCFKTRKELPLGLYRGAPDPDETQRLEEKEPYAWRLSIPACRDYLSSSELRFEETGLKPGIKTFNIEALSDEVIARKDIGTSYYIACTHDDALQNISHIIRGVDLAPLTAFQVLLQHIMDWPTPIYHHHPLIKNDKGEKLSKRNQDTSVHSLRNQGFTPSQVLDMASP